MTQEQIIKLTCKKHIKIFLLSNVGLKNKEVGQLIGSNAGHVYNVLKEYKENPEKQTAALSMLNSDTNDERIVETDVK